uniref:Uncharacterized protein n=1 Tax=Varanus komodoensis TaxID=61221 RepID=A0A8D2ITC9_VARKO
MAAPVEVGYVACCANRAGPGVVSWGRAGLVAFGSCHSVVLYDPQVRREGRPSLPLLHVGFVGVRRLLAHND